MEPGLVDTAAQGLWEVVFQWHLLRRVCADGLGLLCQSTWKVQHREILFGFAAFLALPQVLGALAQLLS